MRHLNKIASVFSLAALTLAGMTSCENNELYTIDSPDWRANAIDSIAKTKGEAEVPMYTVGATDFSTGWWTKFSHYYQIPEGKTWEAEFDLVINPDAPNTYKNYALIITNDVSRGGGGYAEYGAIRYDHQPSGNSEWGTYINRDLVTSNLTFETDTDKGVDKLGGRVKLTVDRSQGGLVVTMDNGVVKKVYNQTDPLENLNADPTNTTIRCFIVPEGSYINFMKTNITSIEDAPDAEPVKMEIKGVPDQIVLGSDLSEVLANMSGTVTFESGVVNNITIKDVQADLQEDGYYCSTNLIVVYNKTSKGNNSSKAIVSIVPVELVDKLSEAVTFVAFPQPVVLGETNNSTGFWTALTDGIKVDRRQTAVVKFTNYTNCLANWNNWCVVLNGEALNEYAVVRADNYGWGDGYTGCTTSGGQTDWDAWRVAMDGAKVTMHITNVGDGTANISAQMIGNDGVTYTQFYTGIAVNRDDCYFRLLCEGSHLVFATQEDYIIDVHPQPAMLGESNCSSAWWSQHTDNIKVDPFMTARTTFTNYSNGVGNWNNFVVVLNGEALNEYAVVRADNYGWGSGYDGNDDLQLSGGQDWPVWLAAMNGAQCTVSVTNKGNGYADVDCEMLGTDGVTYIQYYHNIKIDSEDFYFRFTVDGSHLVFE